MTESSVNLIEEYYRLHINEIRTFVSNRIISSVESEDIVQDAFLRLLNTDKMISPVTLPCLVYSIIRNMIADYWRHHKIVVHHDIYIKHHYSLSEAIQEPISVYATTEIVELLEHGMARLSPKTRNIYSMNVISGMRISEISNTLGEKYKSVENKLYNARKEMRRYIRKMMA